MGNGHGGCDEIEQAIAAELRLHSPEVRTSRELAGELLDPGFVEVGKSGRRWDRDRMLADLPAMTSGEPIRVLDLHGTRLAPGVVHLTYATSAGERHALRSSLWRRGADGRWRMLYHQGTPSALPQD